MSWKVKILSKLAEMSKRKKIKGKEKKTIKQERAVKTNSTRTKKLSVGGCLFGVLNV
jgi:hypothetical protein